MARQHLLHDSDVPPQQGAGVLQGGERESQLLTAAEAARYVRCKTVKAFYAWRKRHGVVVFANGLHSRKALDRVLAQPRKPRVMAPASLANLRRKVSA